MSTEQPARQPRRRRTFAELTGLYAHPVGHPEHERSQIRYEFLIPDTRRDLQYGVYLTMALAKHDPDPLVAAMYDTVREYFAELADLLNSARSGDQTAFRRARRMARFPEPKELGFGYARHDRSGNGMDEGPLNDRVLATLFSHPALAAACAEEPDALAFVEMVALDRVSDAVATITKSLLVEFTQQMALHYRFSPDCLKVVPVANVWCAASGVLQVERHEVPVADDGSAILVVPKGIVRSAPPFSAAQYTRYWYPGRKPMAKAEVLADIGSDPQRLLVAMRATLKDEWRYRPRRDLRND